MIPEELKKLADELSQLPGIGPRQAMRLSFFISRKTPTSLSLALSAVSRIRACSQCFFPHARKEEMCSICSDKIRNQLQIAVVEKETDLISIEKTNQYRGTYLVLGELQKNGLLEESHKQRLKSLKIRISKTGKNIAQEIIIALSPTTYGDLNAQQIMKEVSEFTEKVTRLGRGIPTGGEVEFSDEETLTESLKNRN